MAQSVRSKIADAIIARLGLVTAFKYRAFDVVRLQASDFSDFELPAAQIIDLAEIATHEGRRKKATWNLVIEVIVGPDGQAATPSQQTLWDLMQAVEETLWAVPNLGLKDVIHMQLLTSSTDLHLMHPFYLGRIELAVLYYQSLVGPC